MRSSRNAARTATEKRDFLLFVTPPTGERPLSVEGPHNGDDEDLKDRTSSGDVLYEDSAPKFHSEFTSGYYSIRKDGCRILRTFNLDTSHSEAVSGVDFQFPARQGDIGTRNTDMASSERSLTSSAVPFRSELTPDRHCFAGGINSEPHQVRPNSLNAIPTLNATSDSKPTKHLQSLG